LERVNAELETRMVMVFEELMGRSERDGTRLREAAFDIALERVGRAIRLRGFV
jgi:glutamate dehydrogenase/leucine dehydrogenase